MITVGSVISDIQDRTFHPEDTSYEVRYIEEEASKITSGGSVSQLERQNYENLISKMDYSSDVEYWDREDYTCINVTLTSPDGQIELPCMGRN